MIAMMFLVALWCNGLTIISQPGEIMDFVNRPLSRLPLWIARPLLLCISCMASIHTGIVMLMAGYYYWWHYPIIAIGAAFLNPLLYLLFQIVEHEYFMRKSKPNDRANIH